MINSSGSPKQISITSGTVQVGDMMFGVRSVADLSPSEYNPRTITPRALAGLKLSIERFSMVEPIVWNERTGRVVGGHQRLRALRELGVEKTVVAIVSLDEAEEKALNLTLNNDALMGQFNEATTALLEAAREALPADIFEGLRFEEIFYPGKVLDFVPGAALDYGVGPSASELDVPESGVRVLRLILSDDSLAEVKGLLRKLEGLYGIDDATDIIIQALRDVVSNNSL
jgi:hypothetical protein